MHTPDTDRRSLWPTSRELDATWQPWSTWMTLYGAHLLLGIGTVLSLLPMNQTWSHRFGTLGLVATAAVWELLTCSLLPARRRENAAVVALSFLGMMTIAAVLMSRDLVFLTFMLAGFFRALRLRPVAFAIVGLAVCSLLINTLGGDGPIESLRAQPFMFVTIITVQTLSIAGGSFAAAKVHRQNEQRRQALDELEAAQEENAGLHRQLLAQAREAGMVDERQRLSQEIHDTLAQGFTGIITQLQAAEQARDDALEWQRHLDTAATLARENLAEARRSVHALSPEPLESARLPDALRGVAERWSERSMIEVAPTTTGEPHPMHPEIEASILRIAQEALSNVAKHARASMVGLTLSYMEDQVTLDVRDDGVGFIQGQSRADRSPSSGFGLSGIRQRTQRLAGVLHVESEPGQGTAISVSFPALTPPLDAGTSALEDIS